MTVGKSHLLRQIMYCDILKFVFLRFMVVTVGVVVLMVTAKNKKKEIVIIQILTIHKVAISKYTHLQKEPLDLCQAN